MSTHTDNRIDTHEPRNATMITTTETDATTRGRRAVVAIAVAAGIAVAAIGGLALADTDAENDTEIAWGSTWS